MFYCSMKHHHLIILFVLNCTVYFVNSSKCSSEEFQCGSGKCIPKLWQCDQDSDCEDSSDELGCTPRSCSISEFECENGKCIPQRWKCDGDTDCADASDEAGCTPQPTITACRSTAREFRCANGQCIHRSWRCDSESDCYDSSDEANCTMPCSADEWRCDSGQCIDRLFRCNNVKNCPDNSDEGKCNSTDHNNTTNNNHSLTNNTEAYLLLSQRRSLNIINLSSERSTPLVNKLRTAVSLDYSYNGHQLFFSDVRSRTIYVFNISVSSKNTTSTLLETVVNNTDTVDGIAYDWVHDILYWTDKGSKTIELLTMSGRHHKTIVSVHLDEPRGIALDPRDGQKWLYWTDWGDKPRIEKAGLDGSNRALVVATDIGWPNDVTIDFAGDRLYWVDGKHHSISSSDLNGQNVQMILSQQPYTMHPFSIDVFGDKIYWSDWNTDSVHQANKHNGTNPCGVNNGGCSHICLAAPSLGSAARKFNCFCPDGKHVNEDGRTCYTPGPN